MGTDIRAFTEVKINGVWHNYTKLAVDRNYALFARLADVRNETEPRIEPIDEPRGLPEDVSFIVRFIHQKDNGRHSTSWLSILEIADLEKWGFTQGWKKRYHESWLTIQIGYLFNNTYSSWIDYPENRPIGVLDVRIVFWFDS